MNSAALISIVSREIAVRDGNCTTGVWDMDAASMTERIWKKTVAICNSYIRDVNGIGPQYLNDAINTIGGGIGIADGACLNYGAIRPSAIDGQIGGDIEITRSVQIFVPTRYSQCI